MGDAGLSVPGARPQACAMVEQIRACQTQPDPYLRTLHYKLPPAEREKVVEFIAQVRRVPLPTLPRPTVACTTRLRVRNLRATIPLHLALARRPLCRPV